MISCIYCNQSRKKLGQKALPFIQSASDIVIEKIAASSTILQNSEALWKISSVDASRVFYHDTCKLMFTK